MEEELKKLWDLFDEVNDTFFDDVSILWCEVLCSHTMEDWAR